MKKIISVFFTSLIVLLMFVGPGNVANAEGECGCITEEITGAEKNIIISKILKSDVFKSQKQELLKDGFTWNGVNKVEVQRNITYDGLIMVGVPFINEDGIVMMATFFNGYFVGLAPYADNHNH